MQPCYLRMSIVIDDTLKQIEQAVLAARAQNENKRIATDERLEPIGVLLRDWT